LKLKQVNEKRWNNYKKRNFALVFTKWLYCNSKFIQKYK